MKTIIGYLLALAALFAPAWGVVSAQTVTRVGDTVSTGHGNVDQLKTNPTLRSEGKILLLDSDRVMEGEIVRQGDQYLVRRTVGEVWLPARQVKYVGESWHEVLAIMYARANLLDPDERVRLARWCHEQGQHELALDELQHALRLQPNHGPSRHLLRIVEKAVDIAGRSPAAEKPREELAVAPSLDLNAEAMSSFVTRIQPILMNTCARCHANDQGGNFHLKRVYGSGVTSRRTTALNLSAVVEQIDLDRPNLSPLLIKAVSAHGTTASPPIKSRREQPYQLLQKWVDSVLRENPHLKELRHVAGGRPSNSAAASPSRFGSTGAAPSHEGNPSFAGARSDNAGQTLVSVGGQESRIGSGGQERPPHAQQQPPRELPMFREPLPAVEPRPGTLSGGIQQVSAPSEEPAKPLPPRQVPIQANQSAPPGTTPARQPRTPVDEFDPLIFNEQMHPGRQE